MNRQILIFTDCFPYGKSEPFLEPELIYIAEAFKKVTLLALEKGLDKNLREIPSRTDMISPVFNHIKNKTELLIKGLFNTSLLCRLFGEGIRSGAWKSMTKFRIWFTHFLLIRSLLSDIKKRDLIRFFNQYDILYFYWGLRWSQIIPFLPLDLKSKIIVRFHGSDLYEHTNHRYIPWRNQQLVRIHSAVVISDTGKKYITDHYQFPADRIFLSRIGTKDYGRNPSGKPESTRIISCSNLVPVKRVGLLVEALMFIQKRIEWIHFGDGAMRNEIEELCADLPQNINWKLAGAVNHAELMSFYSSVPVDLFINVSSSEGVPVSIMEAMSFGIPAMATDAGGTSELVSEKTGLLINIDIAPQELAFKIEELISRPDISTLRRGAREIWENKSMADKVYPDFINHLLFV